MVKRKFLNLFIGNIKSKSRIEREREKILSFLYEIQSLESKLWGIIVKDINSQEEKVLEDSNHLVYLYSTGKHDSLNKILSDKEFKDFLKDLNDLKTDFKTLKKTIREKDKLKLLLSNFTIKLVDAQNYENFKDVFVLERMLYDVLDSQDEELSILISEIARMKVKSEEKMDVFLDSLKEIRRILSGHMETHDLFEEERSGFSNVSNIIYELIKIFKKELK